MIKRTISVQYRPDVVNLHIVHPVCVCARVCGSRNEDFQSKLIISCLLLLLLVAALLILYCGCYC